MRGGLGGAYGPVMVERAVGESHGSPVRVFCSHRSVDKPVVLAFAERLRADGVDAWVDSWEIGPGDEVIARLDEGLSQCDVGLLFLSGDAESGPFLLAELNALQMMRIEDGTRLIPVVLDDEAESFIRARPLLRALHRRPIADYDAIRDALLDRNHRPGLGIGSRATTVDAAVEVRPDGEGGATVSLTVDGRLVCEEQLGRVPAGLSTPTSLDQVLLDGLGDRVGRLVFPGRIGVELAALIAGLGASRSLMLTFLADPAFSSVAFEAARLADGSVPARHRAVRVNRRIANGTVGMPTPTPGPLKILVTVGTPDEGQTPSVALDREAEIGAILDAVGATAGSGRAEVQVLEVANAETIARALSDALARGGFHVLHLSGHGSSTSIELETEDGAAVPTSATDLVAAIQASGAQVPLVFLSACHGVSADRGLAADLVRAGVPRVVAMQSAVTDAYATALAKAFYDRLAGPPSEGSQPALAGTSTTACDALAHARHEAGVMLRREYGDKVADEWPAPTLLLSDRDEPMIDSDLVAVRLAELALVGAGGVLPVLGEAGLIGRRHEIRTAVRALRSGRAVALTGIGGIGKSSIAGRLASRLVDDGWLVSTTQGSWSLNGVYSQLLIDLALCPHPWAAQLAEALGRLPDSDQARISGLQHALGTMPLLLVFDNFEDNLTVDVASFLDPVVATIAEQLAAVPGPGAVLFTCRYPLPGLDHVVDTVELPPLTLSETRRLFLRLPGLRMLDRDDAALVRTLIGGHPRSLELLDALLRQGHTDRPHLAVKLRELAPATSIDITNSVALSEAVADTVTLSAADIVLEQLTAGLSAVERATLLQVAVSNLPVETSELPELVADDPDPTDWKRILDRLSDLTLLVEFEDDTVWVHRWTAEALQRNDSDTDHRRRAARAGQHRLRPRDGGVTLDNAVEASRNLIIAQQWDGVAQIAQQICEILAQTSTVALVGLAGEFQRSLPITHSAHKIIADHEAQALLALGYTAASFDRYQTLITEHQRLVGAEPDRADYQRDLSVSHERMASATQVAGDLTESAQWQLRGIEIHRRLVAGDPENAELVCELGVKLHNMAPISNDPVSMLVEVVALLTPLAEAGLLDERGQKVLDSALNQRKGITGLEVGPTPSATQAGPNGS